MYPSRKLPPNSAATALKVSLSTFSAPAASASSFPNQTAYVLPSPTHLPFISASSKFRPNATSASAAIPSSFPPPTSPTNSLQRSPFLTSVSSFTSLHMSLTNLLLPSVLCSSSRTSSRSFLSTGTALAALPRTRGSNVFILPTTALRPTGDATHLASCVFCRLSSASANVGSVVSRRHRIICELDEEAVLIEELALRCCRIWTTVSWGGLLRRVLRMEESEVRSRVGADSGGGVSWRVDDIERSGSSGFGDLGRIRPSIRAVGVVGRGARLVGQIA